MNRHIAVLLNLLVGGLVATAVMAEEGKDLTGRIGEKGETWASYSSGSVQSAIQHTAGLGEDFAANSAFGQEASTY